MTNKEEVLIPEKIPKIRNIFWDKRFLYYTVTGLIISGINVALLWLFIDIVGIPTVVSGILVVGITFILRYILFIFFKIF